MRASATKSWIREKPYGCSRNRKKRKIRYNSSCINS